MKVLKFGGTSVGSSKSIRQIKDIIEPRLKSEPLIVVVSAVGGITNKLLKISELALNQDNSYKELIKDIETSHLEIIHELLPASSQSKIISKTKQELNNLEILIEGIFLLREMSPKTSDKITSFGEILSSKIINEYFISQNIKSTHKDSRELIITDETYGRANVNFKRTNELCNNYFKDMLTGQVVVTSGFVACSESGYITTLGRGGSDYSSAIIAAAIDAEMLEIWTDVSGVFTANPTLVKQAKPITKLSYLEAMELSHFGAKVLYAPTIQPVLSKNIPLYIKNTFDSNSLGTYISDQSNRTNGNPIKSISHIDHIALITLEGSGMVGVAGVARKLFTVLSRENISVILITQASSEHSICVCIDRDNATRAQKAINEAFESEINRKEISPCSLEEDLSILAVVGDGMRDYQGLGGKMFSALGRNNVNIRAIAQGASERNISTVINQSDASKALNILHECFFEEDTKLLNLFITGVGNVGQKLLEQLHQQEKYLKEHLRLQVRVVGISNSKKMCFDKEGIDLSNWKKFIEKGEIADKESFFNNVKTLNLRNSVFVDNTASTDISNIYETYLSNSISIVTCNKIACSSDIKHYKHLKSLSRKFGAQLLFETNVGAALPIISTLRNLIASGDNISEIHAVLSGSLNFVFNKFDRHHKFHEIVNLAKKEGYTEPNPKIDLSGIDVARKILILVRESGLDINIEDIKNSPFLPEECLKINHVDEFLKSLEKNQKHFDDIYENAYKNNCKLKYVAHYKNGKAGVGLQEIEENHPFYNLEGKDNIVLFYTKRYGQQPLIIKGAGAGAEVTASGIFSDIITLGNS